MSIPSRASAAPLPLPRPSDPYRECFVAVARALQGQKGRHVSEALRALAFARRTALDEYAEILSIAQLMQDMYLAERDKYALQGGVSIPCTALDTEVAHV